MLEAKPIPILVVDDDPAIQSLIQETFSHPQLGNNRYLALPATTPEEALKILAKPPLPRLALVDLALPDPAALQGLGLARTMRAKYPEMIQLAVSGSGEPRVPILARQAGMYDFIPKPFDTEKLIASIDSALEQPSFSQEVAQLQEQIRGRSSSPENRLIGTKSPAMRNFLGEIGTIVTPEMDSASPTHVLIRGGFGSGTTEAPIVAEIINYYSSRGMEGKVVRFDPARISSQLMEGELYGTVKGVYPGITDSEGLIEQARHGTFFISDLVTLLDYPAVRSALMGMMHGSPIVKVGSHEPIKDLQIRVVAFSNQDPMDLHRKHPRRFPEGLTSWGARLVIPSLNERREDFPEIIAGTLEGFNHHSGITDEAVELLTQREWPGNVLQFRDAIQGAIAEARGRVIELKHLKMLPEESKMVPQDGN